MMDASAIAAAVADGTTSAVQVAKAALALPAGFRENRTGLGITPVGPAWTDRALRDAGDV